VFDMATSAMTFYGLVLAKAKNELIPEDMAIDKDGNPTTNPTEAMSGALLPFDRSYKGSGLGMFVETLAGPFVNGAWIDNKTFEEEWGSLFIAIDPDLLVDTADFKKEVTQMISDIKAARRANGISEIRLPGESSASMHRKSLESGFVDVDDVVLESLGYL